MWAVVDAAILRPLPYRDGDAVVSVMETHPQRGLMAVTPANFLDWAARVKSLEAVAGAYAIEGESFRRWDAGTGDRHQSHGWILRCLGRTAGVGARLQPGDFASRQRVVVLATRSGLDASAAIVASSEPWSTSTEKPIRLSA
jgi:hypothetical protein